MKNRELKSKFFNKGAAALRNITGIDTGYYCCPICTKLYSLEALEVDMLTLEHAPPKQIGGKPLALTCKDCNSVAGYSVDAAVVQRQRLLNFGKALTGQQQNFKGRAIFKIGGEALNINFEITEGIPSIRPPTQVNDPRKLKAYQDHMMHLHKSGKWNGEECTIIPTPGYHYKYSKIGDLKSAFVISFAFFGYRFALNERLSAVREQIMNYEQDIIDYYWLPSEPKVSQDHFICLTDKPVTALAVKLDTSTVILPWIEGPIDLYNHLNNLNRKGPLNFHGRFFSWPLSLDMRLDFIKST